MTSKLEAKTTEEIIMPTSPTFPPSPLCPPPLSVAFPPLPPHPSFPLPLLSSFSFFAFVLLHFYPPPHPKDLRRDRRPSHTCPFHRRDPRPSLFSVVTWGQPSSLDYPTVVKVTTMKGEVDAVQTPAGSRGALLSIAGPPHIV